MTLSERIQLTDKQVRHVRQRKAEKRLDEIVSVGSIAEDYRTVDARGDEAIESHFRSLYHLVDSPVEKQAVAAAYVTWQKSEAAEDRAVHGSVGGSVNLLKRNNDFWLNDGCGPGWRRSGR